MKEKRKVTTFEAFLPMICMALMVIVGNIIFGIRIEFILLLASLIAGLVSVRAGYTWDELIEAYNKKFAKAFPAILILIAVGGIVGTWMYSGTVPMMIYYGLKFLHPKFVVVTAFVVTAIVSTFTGTSWGSAATSGVAFMGIATSMGIPLPLVAGAIISGAFFGDKVSPVSDTTNLSALASEVTVYDHIKGMLPNVTISAIIAIIGYTLVGTFYYNGNSQLSEATLKIMEDLDSLYNFNILMLLPPIIVFGGGYFGFPALLLMLASSVVAMVVGTLSNGFIFTDAVTALLQGFNVSMAEVTGVSVADLSPRLLGLLNRGGFSSMMSGSVMFCFLAIPFGSFMEVSGSLDRIVEQLSKIIKGAYSLIVVTFFTGATINAITSNGQFSILTTGQLFKENFKKKNIPLNVLSRTMENSMTLLECMLPWHVTAIYMASTLGVQTTEYIKYSFFNILGIVIFFIISYFVAKKVENSIKIEKDIKINC
ncbi:Na+/H+ antiporter NhaC [Fusobacterium mortiferum]|uniref:Na+/H+ antiporter NhaC n=1 Tax=Fusobacterium mortiferum TaxID=850 RepID=UPI003566DB74